MSVRLEFTHRVKDKKFIASPEQMRYHRLRRRVKAWADARMRRGFRTRMLMITLTYGGSGVRDFGWKPNHIRDYMRLLRRRLGSGLVAYTWVMELQKRGAPHYHILLSIKKNVFINAPDAPGGGWVHGMSRITSVRTRYYVLKYAQKSAFYDSNSGVWREFPKGARLFAVWLSEAFSPAQQWKFRLSAVPRWLSDVIASDVLFFMARWERAGGGGWYVISARDDYVVRLLSPWMVRILRDDEYVLDL